MGPLLTSLLLRTRGQQNALKFIADVHGSRFVVSDLFLVSATVSSWCTMSNVHISISSPHQLLRNLVVMLGSKCSAGIRQLNVGGFYPLNLSFTIRIRSRLKILI